MFTDADNQLLARVGPGTPMGEVFRRFWQPFLLAQEVAEPDGPPVRVTLLGEKLICFRDTTGRLGLVDRYCAHRRAELFFARNEECGLRCTYHGWKFDIEGNVLEMPAEPPNTPLLKEVKLKAYPVREWGGVIWAYMGPRNKMPPEPPQLEWGMVPDSHRYITKRLQESNYAQGVEGGIDSSHVSILHSKLKPEPDRPFRERQVSISSQVPYLAMDTSPKFFIRDTDYGFLIGARRTVSEDEYYWRITQFLLPFYTIIARTQEDGPMMGHAWTPIDDHNTWTFTMTWNPVRPLGKDIDDNHVHADTFDDGSYRPKLNRNNEYGLDREHQRLHSCSGMAGGIGIQDSAIQESMGPITDRAKEHLGTSDSAIVSYRKRLLKLARDFESGIEPAPPAHPEWYKVRTAGVVLKKGIDFQEGAGRRLVAV